MVVRRFEHFNAVAFLLLRMDFINSPVGLQGLPLIEDIELQPVHPAYKKVLQIEWVISSAVLAAVAALVIFTNATLRHSSGWALITAAVILLCGFYYFSIRQSFRFLSFAIREKDVINQKGWIIRRVKICPFNRIQNCSVQSGPLERKYRLASLVIYTAGTNGADMRISGLLHEEAERLRHFILDKIHAEPNEAV